MSHAVVNAGRAPPSHGPPSHCPPTHDKATAAQRRSLFALDGLNFFVADMLTGFGPFVSVYLIANQWSQSDIGLAFSIGTAAAFLGQVPAGMLVDAVSKKRVIAGAGVLAIIIAALTFAMFPAKPAVFGVEVMFGIAGALLTPAIAALTLTLVHDERLGVRLGSNVRWKAIGSGIAAFLMGFIGDRISPGAVFYVAAGFGVAALGCLCCISTTDVKSAPKRTRHPSAWHHRDRKEPLAPTSAIWRDPTLLAFAGCMFLFQLGNAAALPFAFSALEARTHAGSTEFVVSAALIVSQIVVAATSPSVGRFAQSHGRKLILASGLGLLVLRCLVLAVVQTQYVIIGLEVLDGLTGAVIGVMVPLMAADITHRGGRFNLALGLIGLASLLGAALSTFIAGRITQMMGISVTFLTLALAGGLGCLCVVFVLPETARTPIRKLRARTPKHAV